MTEICENCGHREVSHPNCCCIPECKCKKFIPVEYIECNNCGIKVKRTGRSHKYCKACIKKRDLKSAHKWLDKNKDNSEFKFKKNVRNKAWYHIKIPKGQLCVTCNKRKAVDKHHDDYLKPLEVMFVCKPCHNKIHEGVKYKK